MSLCSGEQTPGVTSPSFPSPPLRTLGRPAPSATVVAIHTASAKWHRPAFGTCPTNIHFFMKGWGGHLCDIQSSVPWGHFPSIWILERIHSVCNSLNPDSTSSLASVFLMIISIPFKPYLNQDLWTGSFLLLLPRSVIKIQPLPSLDRNCFSKILGASVFFLFFFKEKKKKKRAHRCAT